MSRVVGGIRLEQTAVVRPASDRYRDMYGGAVAVEVEVDGVCIHLDLDVEGATALANALRLAARDSAAAYEAALARRKDSS